jgi:CRP/FNR family cyclic AMP-dependent transcriptional regulator
VDHRSGGAAGGLTGTTMTGPDEDARIERASTGSFLAALPAGTRRLLTAGAIPFEAPAGSIVYRSDDAPRLGLIVDGLVRVFLTSADGRQLTVRYARTGDALGVPTAFGGPVGTSVQSLTRTSVLVLDLNAVRSIARRDPAVAWALGEEVTRRLYEVLEAFGGNVFGSVRQRVARHLLDLAADRQTGTALVAGITQQALADAAGTAREVVARTLADLRRAGLVETTRAGIALLDPDRLSTVAATGEL